MSAGLVWTVVGSLAGVLTVLAAVIFGVLQLRQGKKNGGPWPRVRKQRVQAGRDAYTAGGDQYIAQDRRRDE